MAAKASWHRYGTKLRHCHPVYSSVFNPKAFTVSCLVTPQISWSDPGLAPVESGPGFLLHRCVFGTNVGSECGHYRTRVCRRPWTSGIMPRPWTVTFRRATTSNTMKSPQILWSISRRSPWQNPPAIFSTVCSQKWRRIQERSLTRFLVRSWAPTKWGGGPQSVSANSVGAVGPKVWAVAPTDFRAHENSRPTLAENCTEIVFAMLEFRPASLCGGSRCPCPSYLTASASQPSYELSLITCYLK